MADEVYIYKEENFHIDPADVFIYGKVGVGVTRDLKPDEDFKEAHRELTKTVEGMLAEEVDKANKAFDEKVMAANAQAETVKEALGGSLA